MWEQSKSKENILETLKKIEKTETLNSESLNKIETVKNYKEDLTKIFDAGESKENIESYKNSVLNLLKLKNKLAN